MTTPNDLWITMETIHKDMYPKRSLFLRKTINNWITKKYYPVLNVTLNYDIVTIKYFASPYVFGNNQTETWIPVTYATNSYVNYDIVSDMNVCSDDICMFWMYTPTYLRHIYSYDWIIFNVQQIGKYYIINISIIFSCCATYIFF